MPLASYLPDPDKWIRTTPASASKARAKVKSRPLVGFQHGLPTPPSSGIRGHAARHAAGGGVSAGSASRTPGHGQVAGEGLSVKGKERVARGVPTPPTTSSVPKSRVQRIRDDILREYDASIASGPSTSRSAGKEGSGGRALMRAKGQMGNENAVNRYNGSPAPIARPSKLNFSTSTTSSSVRSSRPLGNAHTSTSARGGSEGASSTVRASATGGRSVSPQKHPRTDDLDRPQWEAKRQKIKELGRETSSSDLILEHFKRSSDGFDSDNQGDEGRRPRAGLTGAKDLGNNRGQTDSRAATSPHVARLSSRWPSRSHLSNVLVSKPARTQGDHDGVEDVDEEDDGNVTETDEPIIISSPPRRSGPIVHAPPIPRYRSTSSVLRNTPRNRETRPAQHQNDHHLRKDDTSPTHRPDKAPEPPGYTPPEHSPILLTQPPRTVLKRYWSMNGSRVDGFGAGEEPWGKSRGYVDNERRKGERERERDRERERERRKAVEKEMREMQVQEEANVDVEGGSRAEAKAKAKMVSRVQSTGLRGMEERPLRGLRKRDTGGVDLFVEIAPDGHEDGAIGGASSEADYWGEGDVISLMVRSSTPADTRAPAGTRTAIRPVADAPAPLVAVSRPGSSPTKRRRTEKTPPLTGGGSPLRAGKDENAIAAEIVGRSPKRCGTDSRAAEGAMRMVLSPLRVNAVSHTTAGVTKSKQRPAQRAVSPTPLKIRRSPAAYPGSMVQSVNDDSIALHIPDTPYRHWDEEGADIGMGAGSDFSTIMGESGSASEGVIGAESDGIPATNIAPLSLFPTFAASPRKAARFSVDGAEGRAAMMRGADENRYPEQSPAKGPDSGSGAQMRPPPRPSARPIQRPRREAAGVGAAATVSGGQHSGGMASDASDRNAGSGGGGSGQREGGSGRGSARSDETQSLAPTAHSDSFPSLLPSQSVTRPDRSESVQQVDAAPPLSVQRSFVPAPAEEAAAGTKAGAAGAGPAIHEGQKKDKWAAFGDLVTPSTSPSSRSPPQVDTTVASTSQGRAGAASTKKRARAEPDISDFLSGGNVSPQRDANGATRVGPSAGRISSAASRKATRKSTSSTRTPSQVESNASRPKQTTLQAFGIVRERVSRPSIGEGFELDFEDEDDIAFDGVDELYHGGGERDVDDADDGTDKHQKALSENKRTVGMGKGKGVTIMDAPPLHPGLRLAGVRAMRERERTEAARQHTPSAKPHPTAAPSAAAAPAPPTSSFMHTKSTRAPSTSPSPEPILFSPAKRPLPQSDHVRAADSEQGVESITSLGPTQHSPGEDGRFRYQYHSSSSLSFGNSDDDASSSAVGAEGEESVRARVSEETKAWWDRLGRE